MMNNFIICACFARSFDEFHVKNKKIHLISSIVSFEDNIESIENSLENLNSWSVYSREIKYLFVVLEVKNVEGYEDQIQLNRNYINLLKLENLVVIFVSIDQLIGHLSFTIKNNELFENIFGNKDLKAKDFDNIYQNSL